MDTWKTAGCVPDSDEEDVELELSIPAQIPPRKTKIYELNAEQKSTQTLEFGTEHRAQPEQLGKWEKIDEQELDSEQDELAGQGSARYSTEISEHEVRVRNTYKGARTVDVFEQASVITHERISQDIVTLAGGAPRPAIAATQASVSPEDGSTQRDAVPDDGSSQRPQSGEGLIVLSKGRSYDSPPTSTLSSPLSSPSQSPLRPSQWEDVESLPTYRSFPQVLIPLSPAHGLLQNINEDETGHLPSSTLRARTFRERKAIQLHPYMLEEEQYKKNMHSRGIKASLIRHPSTEEPWNSEDDDTQPFRPSPEPHSPRPQPSPTSSIAMDIARPDWNSTELPEIEDLLKDKHTELPRPKKRRKMDSAHSLSELRNQRHTSPARQFRAGQDLLTPRHSDEHNVPMSPSLQATSATQSKPKIGFRRPPTVRPAQLQTPARSASSNDQTLALPSSPPSSPDSMPASSRRRRRLVSRAEASTASEDSHESADDGRNQAAAFKKRIRGVLPASWTTLNLKKPETLGPRTLARSKTFSTPAIPARGIAGPVSAYRRSPDKQLQQTSIMIFSDDSPSSSPAQVKARENTPLLQESLVLPIDEMQAWPDSDEMEDDNVDLMLPSNTLRKRRYSRKSGESGSRKRLKQTRITSTDRRSTAHSTARQSKRPRKLGILDVQTESPTQNRPTFIRVAARTARSRQDQGRSRPAGKAFHLHHNTDDRDIKEVMRRWTDSAGQLDKYEVESRLPLAVQSGNEQRITLDRLLQTKPKVGTSKKRGQSASSAAQKRSNRRRGISGMTAALGSLFAERNTAGPKEPGSLQQAMPLKSGRASLTPWVRSWETKSAGQLSVPVLEAQESSPAYTGGRIPIDLRLEPENDTAPHTSLQSKGSEGDVPWQYSSARRSGRKRRPRQLRLGASDVGPWIENSEIQHAVDLGGTAGAKASPRRVSFQGTKFLEPWISKELFDTGRQSLLSGIHFPASSFLGSGRFQSCLNASASQEQYIIRDEGTSRHRQLAWTEIVRDDVSREIETVRQKATVASLTRAEQRDCLHSLENVAVKLACDVYLLDPVDRTSMIRCGASLVGQLEETDIDEEGVSPQQISMNRAFRCHLYARLAVITHGLIESHQGSIDAGLQKDMSTMLRRLLLESAAQLRHAGFAVLRSFVEGCKDLQTRPSEEATELTESFVILNSIIQKHSDLGSTWAHFQAVGKFAIHALPNELSESSILVLEQEWRDIFTLLPLLNLGPTGCFDSHSGPESGNWSLVRQLVKPVLDAYELNGNRSALEFNTYLRILFKRCFSLIETWHWTKCDSVIGFLFDFFGKHGLANLKDEECHRSPRYLSILSENPTMVVEAGDTCFHLLLKIIVVGMSNMRSQVSEKKIQNLIWRLLPNHDRQHPKDQEIRETDLDATRNHHDLLCTLYWIAPVAHRPSLNTIRNLVQAEGSHRQAYNINIQAWLYLLKFQISCDSTHASLEPFIEWYDDLLGRLLKQHSLARSEAESYVKQSEAAGYVIDNREKEKTVAKNQKQLEAVIIDLLSALEESVSLCPSPESAAALLTTRLGRVFDLFDPVQTRINDTLIAATGVINIAVTRGQSFPTEVAVIEEDSQGFDWSGFEDLEEHEPIRAEPILNLELYRKLYTFVSSCFSAGLPPPDRLLRCLADTWSNIVLLYVRRNIKTWDNYLGLYGHESWAVIADTEQKRRFTPYFITRLLESESNVWIKQRQLLLSSWMISLCDRDAMLRYQGDFTAAVLNAGPQERLLRNLPLTHAADGRYSVSTATVQQRRVAILASVFSNMRSAVFSGENVNPLMTRDLKDEYKATLQTLMTAIKARYQELSDQQESQSAYVKFVHAIIRALQEHVQELCPLDPFFTSSAAFPLPSDDPTYVVSKLKAYALRMTDPKTHKQLATFLRSALERTIYDGADSLLIQQLITATRPGDEDGPDTPDLGSFFLNNLLPAYLEAAMSDPCGWNFALPIMATAGAILARSGLTLDGCNRDSVRAHLDIYRPITTLIHGTLDLNDFFTTAVPVQSAKVLRATFTIVEDCLPVLDYIFELGQGCRDILWFLTDLVHVAEKSLHALDAVGFQESWSQVAASRRTLNTLDSLQKYIRTDLDDCLGRRSRYEGGKCLLARGKEWKVVADLTDHNALRQDLIIASKGFKDAVARSPAFGHLVY